MIRGNSPLDDRFIDMWQPDGKQILKNGAGYYYRFEMVDDSLVFQIKDSVFNGSFKRYRFQNNKYVLIETGQYKNYQRTGTFTLVDSVNRHKIVKVYSKNKEIEHDTIWNENLKITEISHFINGKITGALKLFDDKGKLLKVINNKNGERFGEYKEYYPNGAVKIIGQYTQTDTTATVQAFDKNGNEVTKQVTYKVARQTGKWKYYDDTGKLIRTEANDKDVNGSR